MEVDEEPQISRKLSCCMPFIYNNSSIHAGHQLNDIKTVYHPRTGKAPLIQSLDEYNASKSTTRTPPKPTENPWAPYETRLDFEFSEFAMTAYLNKEHVEKLITLLNTAAARQDKLTITSNTELVTIREKASTMLTPVCDFCVLYLKHNEGLISFVC